MFVRIICLSLFCFTGQQGELRGCHNDVMNMKEYIGIFCTGDFASKQYSVASVWQPANAILCDDRFPQMNSYRGPYWLIFNFFRSSTLTTSSDDQGQDLLSSLSQVAYCNGIKFMLCHIEQSSMFRDLCQQIALAKTTEMLSRTIVSDKTNSLGGNFDSCPIWLVPRDFSSLLFFNSPVECLSARL